MPDRNEDRSPLAHDIGPHYAGLPRPRDIGANGVDDTAALLRRYELASRKESRDVGERDARSFEHGFSAQDTSVRDDAATTSMERFQSMREGVPQVFHLDSNHNVTRPDDVIVATLPTPGRLPLHFDDILQSLFVLSPERQWEMCNKRQVGAVADIHD